MIQVHNTGHSINEGLMNKRRIRSKVAKRSQVLIKSTELVLTFKGLLAGRENPRFMAGSLILTQSKGHQLRNHQSNSFD